MEQAGDGRGSGAERRVAILFAQFAPYHIDRIAAAAERLANRAEVLAVEVAGGSRTYAWERSGEVPGARKITLFPNALFEELPVAAKVRAIGRAVRGCDTVFVGIPYSDPAVVALSWAWRLPGKRVVLMTESKADDAPRQWWREGAKRALLSAYHAAMVGGPRQAAYLRSLGFTRRPVLTGYDTVSIDRVRALAGIAEPDWAERPFLYVGRFVAKKNPRTLLRGYALYAEGAGKSARRLVMAGDGPLREELRRLASHLGMAERIDWLGFLDAPGTAQAMRGALALLLPSTTEQWGLVINEAAAVGLPVIISANVGARETLVREGESGLVLEQADRPDLLAAALHRMAADEGRWQAMRAAALALAPAGDVRHFADAAAKLIAEPGRGR